MEIDVNALSRFYAGYRDGVKMPDFVREGILEKGLHFRKGTLESEVVELKNLRNIFAPELAEKLSLTITRPNYDVPILRRRKSPIYYVYNPYTGEYIGKFDARRVKH